MIACMSAFLCLVPIHIQAQEASIQIEANENQSLIGKKFKVHLLFLAQQDDNQQSIAYSMHPEYKKVLIHTVQILTKQKNVMESDVLAYMQNLKTNEDILKFTKELRKNLPQSAGKEVVVNQVDENKNYTIEGLEHGYYLIQEVSHVSQKDAASSLVMLTTSNQASIQIKSDYPVIEKQVWENDDKIGWNAVADYATMQSIPFCYRVSIPNMEGYETYSIQMEDTMSEGLILHPESIQIELVGKEKYKLKSDEFELVQKENHFEIRIPDLKRLCQKPYEKMYVTYAMHLDAENIQIQKQYENKVRLVYSNDPYSQSEGVTPWQVNRVYTYGLDLQKVNVEKKGLKEAEFHLYSDKSCKKEVPVQKINGVYAVHSNGKKETIVSDANGNIKIVGLDQGTYYLKEIQAPEGYKTLLQPIQICIQPTFDPSRQSLQNVNIQVNEKESHGTIQIINQPKDELPYTGSVQTMICIGLGLGVVMISCIKSYVLSE